MPILPSCFPFSIKSVKSMDFQSFADTVNVRSGSTRPSVINVRRAWNILNLASFSSTRGSAIRIIRASDNFELCQVVSGVPTTADITTHLDISAASFNSTLSQIKKIFKLITHYDENTVIPAANRRKMMDIKVRSGRVNLIEFPVLSSHCFYGLHFNHNEGSNFVNRNICTQNTVSLHPNRVSTRPSRARGYRARAVAAHAVAPQVVSIQKPKFFDNPFSGMSSIAVFALQFQANP